MHTILVTGSAQAVEPLVTEIRAAGAEALPYTDDAGLVDQLRGLEPGSVSCYVQLPVTVVPAGDTVVARVHSFLEQGLLTRFTLAEAALPALAADASVLLVGGHTPADRHLPDNHSARVALMDVLAHAVQADRLPADTRVQVLDHGSTPKEIAELAVTGRGGAVEEPPARSPERERAYEDWRTELVGLGMGEY